jgi:hypothetical protein
MADGNAKDIARDNASDVERACDGDNRTVAI